MKFDRDRKYKHTWLFQGCFLVAIVDLVLLAVACGIFWVAFRCAG